MSTNYLIETKITQLLTTEQAFHYSIVPIKLENNTITMKTDVVDTTNLKVELEIVLDAAVILELVSSDELINLLTANYRKSSNNTASELTYTPDFLDKILITANDLGSSDIHFESYEKSSRIRFRMDGKLVEQFTITLQEYPTIINKIKIKANLDIAEKRLPQDGRISMKSGHIEFDIRVSTLPTLFGEKIVLRLLNKDTSGINIDELGFSKQELRTYKEAIKKPNGIVLISGPTGSGKTTTLYATLKLLNESKTNILTIEDPIEYTLEGINQVQLKENIGLDFASAMKTFLRQDPDIIMVGEIRDVNTANMGIRAALTGHLVLSTIHTNSAWATISRLIDMGVHSFLIASTLNLSVAQRLVRKLCNHCKLERAIHLDLFPDGFSLDQKINTHFIAKGCIKCHHTGYKGRKAIYEIIPITKELIIKIKENALEIDQYLKEKKINTLQNNAIEMVKEGKTSIDEVYALLT